MGLDIFIQTSCFEFISRIATEEDWKIARELIDDNERFRFGLAYLAAQRTGIKLNSRYIAKVLKVDRRRVSEWSRKMDIPKSNERSTD